MQGQPERDDHEYGTCISLHIRWEQRSSRFQIYSSLLAAYFGMWLRSRRAQRRDFIKLFGQAGPPSIAVCPISTCRNSYTIQPLLAAEAISAAVCVPLYKSLRVRSAAQGGFSLRHKRRTAQISGSERPASPSVPERLIQRIFGGEVKRRGDDSGGGGGSGGGQRA